ncbi:unnamed protein product [Parascedosporium putredinis]|uniref:Uncharacterized protein n=1 Tax=Parascedosporium putredinis TaxID=1442378 RepID=A0A9P1H5E8_9PEZI|nr:unnamed protein product [Parascedosporium putredinis]CAI7999291.1 unnamed protein product [Parascedosporium putredinis]
MSDTPVTGPAQTTGDGSPIVGRAVVELPVSGSAFPRCSNLLPKFCNSSRNILYFSRDRWRIRKTHGAASINESNPNPKCTVAAVEQYSAAGGPRRRDAAGFNPGGASDPRNGAPGTGSGRSCSARASYSGCWAYRSSAPGFRTSGKHDCRNPLSQPTPTALPTAEVSGDRIGSASPSGVPGPYTAENVIEGLGFPLQSDRPADPQAIADECNAIYATIIRVSPHAFQRFVRDSWERSLVGSKEHLQFVLNATLDRVSHETAKASMAVLGTRLMRMAGEELIRSAESDLLGRMEDIIVAKAPDSLLDKAMRRRLETIDARPLLNMLARAERLGYDSGDIIENGVPEPPAKHGLEAPRDHTSGRCNGLADFSSSALILSPLPPIPVEHPYPPPSAIVTADRFGNLRLNSSPATGLHDPYGHLTSAQRREMDIQLAGAESLYAERMRQAQRDILNPGELKVRLDSLKNSLATKQSMVRKKYGVKLRERKTRAEMAEQRARMIGTSYPPPTPSSNDMHHSKKARMNAGDAVPTQVDDISRVHSSLETPTRKPVRPEAPVPGFHRDQRHRQQSLEWLLCQLISPVPHPGLSPSQLQHLCRRLRSLSLVHHLAAMLVRGRR